MTGAKTRQPPLDAAIIDLDGTMVHTMGDFVVAINLMLDELGVGHEVFRANAANIEPLVGRGSENLIKQVLALVDRAQAAKYHVAKFDWALASYQRHYRAINGLHATVYPGVVAGLQQLQAQGLRLACLTNKPAAFAHALLKAKQLDGFFDVMFGGDSFERKKPDPLPLIKTCQALGTSPHRTLMIGDSSNDAMAARAAGCPVWLVTYGYNHGQPVRCVDADGYLDSLTDLLLQDF
ncbi:MAG TPA: phosphoglycolate phosphatase [Burkholderiaceae bacterium]|nr:phosphoglycolate phosphatase [Burkholderiaceae bacterium]